MKHAPTLARGEQVLLVCRHGEVKGRAVILHLLDEPCDCGGVMYAVRIRRGGKWPKGPATVCADLIWRPN